MDINDLFIPNTNSILMDLKTENTDLGILKPAKEALNSSYAFTDDDENVVKLLM